MDESRDQKADLFRTEMTATTKLGVGVHKEAKEAKATVVTIGTIVISATEMTATRTGVVVVVVVVVEVNLVDHLTTRAHHLQDSRTKARLL